MKIPNRLSTPPLHSVTRELAAVARGAVAPDLVIRGARILSVYSERVLSERELWIAHGRIAAVKPLGSSSGRPGAASYDADGAILAPGLVDPHVHIESSMMTACAYAEAALLKGVTTIFCDSHEIGNVCGADGVRWMIEDGRRAALNVFLTVPSTIPATSPQFETSAGDFTADTVEDLFDQWPEAVALGEKMDFVQVAMGDPRSHAILAAALRRNRPVCGHIYGREFVAACAASGVTDTHEAIDATIAEDFVDAGLWLFLRGGNPGTPWNSLPLAIQAVTRLAVNPKRVCVCTDDRDADDLFQFGLDWVVRQAVVAGLSRVTAWSLGSLHPATRFGFDGEIGGLGHGRRADLALIDDSLNPVATWLGGELMVERGRATAALERALEHPYHYPAAARQTVHFGPAPALIPGLPSGPCVANVLKVALPGILTFHERRRFRPRGDWAATLAAEGDLCFVTVIERHGKTGGVAHGLLAGFGLTDGAVASSVGHDAHNLIVAGSNESDMRIAVEALREMRGGVCVVRSGQLAARVALPIAGLLSDQRAGVVAEQTAALKRAWLSVGCILPYMGFNLLPLAVIPEIRLTDKGLVLVPGMEMRPLFE